ncbi:MAG: SMI1/KNR4 family protein [Acidimicrobiales bacterium]
MAVPSELIEQWSRDCFRTRFSLSESSVPQRVRETGHLTVAGATDPQIAALEARLGVTLPPSYRAFLAETNGAFGISDGDSFTGRPAYLLSTDDVAWTRDYDPWYLDLLVTEAVDPSVGDDGVSMFERCEFSPPPPEASYLLGEQGVKDGHAVYCLTIGDWGQAGQIVLNPLNIDAAGEWQVLHLDVMGPNQYPDFESWFIGQVEEAAKEWTTPLDELMVTIEDPSVEPMWKFEPLKALAGWASESEDALELLTRLAPTVEFEPLLQFHFESILFRLGIIGKPPAPPPPQAQQPRTPGPPTPAEQAVAAMAAASEASANDLKRADAALANGDIEGAIDLYVNALSYHVAEAVDRIRKINHPKAWKALDGFARQDALPISMYGYLAAARTASPLLPVTIAEFINNPATAAATIGDTVQIRHCAWLALEIQQTDAAAEVLIDQWRRGNMYALRALARRRDPQILLDCLSLALSDNTNQALAGVQMLRDLRDPYSVDDLVQIIDNHDHREIVTTALHAVVMMAPERAQAVLERTTSRHLDPDLDRLIKSWQLQLATRYQ